MPFTKALYSENFANNEAFSFYCVNLAAIGLMSFLLVRQVRKKENLDQSIGKNRAQWLVVRTAIVPIVFFLCIFLAMWSPRLSRIAFVLIFVLQAIAKWYFMRKSPLKVEVTDEEIISSEK